MKVACREEEICDAVTHGQPTETDEEHLKWFVVAFLVLILIAIIAVRFSNTPAATRGDSNPIYGQQRDLSTPSSRLVGHWVEVPDGCTLYYSPIDRSLDVGTYYWWTPVYRSRSAVKFKILSESRSRWGKQLTTRESIPLIDTILTVEYCIPKNGQSMTKEILFEDGRRVYQVYRYVDSKTIPPFKDF